MSGGVSRIARSTCSESSMSMKRAIGKPSRLIVSWRWIIVMTREPRTRSSARIAICRFASSHRRWISGMKNWATTKSQRSQDQSIAYSMRLPRVGVLAVLDVVEMRVLVLRLAGRREERRDIELRRGLRVRRQEEVDVEALEELGSPAL